ncbi:UNVERIFIED_CONTAM: hypothetical protein NCL1_30767 [Trichonephila clavipes]
MARDSNISIPESVLTYACETCFMSRADENMENGTWQRISNFKLYQSYKESDIVNCIKIQRIKWLGHVVRTDENSTTKNVFNAQTIGTRRKDWSNLRWIDGLEKDLQVLRTKNWRTLVGRRLAWKRLLEKAKTTLGRRATEEGRKDRLDPSRKQHIWCPKNIRRFEKAIKNETEVWRVPKRFHSRNACQKDEVEWDISRSEASSVDELCNKS